VRFVRGRGNLRNNGLCHNRGRGRGNLNLLRRLDLRGRLDLQGDGFGLLQRLGNCAIRRLQ